MHPEYITLLSFGNPGKKVIELIARDVEIEFNIPVVVKETHLDPEEYFNPARGQYDANKLLHMIEDRYANKQSKTLAIFNVDLFIPILTYIFGQAFLNGRAGIASLHRLNNELYGMPPNENLLIERLRKEVIHELGHTFGLIHCANTQCVMRSSTYVEDIDQKRHKFCHKCKSELLSR